MLQLDRLAKIYLPLIFAAIVLISTIARHLTTPIPASSWGGMIALDGMVAVMLAPLLYHCLRTMGTTQGSLFFFTISSFMGSLEALWVFLGKLGILGEAYDYTTGLLWFLGIPYNICVGWFLWLYVFYFLVKRVFPNASALATALWCGLLGLCTDLWMDPVIVNFHLVSDASNLWSWTPTEAPVIFTVPLYNFIGWFLSGATAVYVYQISWSQFVSLQKALARIAIAWVLFAVGTKAIQMGLSASLRGLELFPLGFEAGGALTPTKWALLLLVPILMAICLVVAIWRARLKKENRRDIWLLLGYYAALSFSLRMAYVLQTAFPRSSLVYLLAFPMLLPLGMLLYYLVKPVVGPASR